MLNNDFHLFCLWQLVAKKSWEALYLCKSSNNFENHVQADSHANKERQSPRRLWNLYTMETKIMKNSTIKLGYNELG